MYQKITYLDNIICGFIHLQDDRTWMCVKDQGHEMGHYVTKVDWTLKENKTFGIVFNLPDLELRWHPGMTEDVAPLSRWHRSLLLSMLAEFKLWMFPGGDK